MAVDKELEQAATSACFESTSIGTLAVLSVSVGAALGCIIPKVGLVKGAGLGALASAVVLDSVFRLMQL